MTAYAGGIAVRSGYYWNPGKWEVVPVARDGETLPGARAEHYLRIPLPLVFLVLPAMGGLFVVFLPLIGFLLAFRAALRPITGLFRHSAKGLAATMSAGWRPGEAHFTGKRAEVETKEEKGPLARRDERLEELEREIAEKRRR
jgi:hypothetical protein